GGLRGRASAVLCESGRAVWPGLRKRRALRRAPDGASLVRARRQGSRSLSPPVSERAVTEPASAPVGCPGATLSSGSRISCREGLMSSIRALVLALALLPAPAFAADDVPD